MATVRFDNGWRVLTAVDRPVAYHSYRGWVWKRQEETFWTVKLHFGGLVYKTATFKTFEEAQAFFRFAVAALQSDTALDICSWIEQHETIVSSVLAGEDPQKLLDRIVYHPSAPSGKKKKDDL